MHSKNVATGGDDQKRAFYRDQLITLDDLVQFGDKLMSEFRRILKEAGGQSAKKWLKSAEVRKILGLSPGTLQTLRSNGILPFTKIGGVIYYSNDDIENMLVDNRHISSGEREIDKKFPLFKKGAQNRNRF